MPGDEARALVREVHPAETGLAGPQEGLADRVIVGPHKVIVDGAVLELRGVPVGAKDVGVVAGGDHQVRVHRALGLVQCIYEGALLLGAELHHVPPHCGVKGNRIETFFLLIFP